MQPRRRTNILGVYVDDVTETEVLSRLADFVRDGQPRRVVTPNPEIVMAARADSSYRTILNESDLAVPDGIGLLLAARLAGRPLRAHVRGSDLVLRLAERSAQEGWRWFLLGAGPGVAAAAAHNLQARFPRLQIAGSMPGAPDPAFDIITRRAIQSAGPVQVLAVAYGAPRQERWIARNQLATGIPIQIGVGGAFDFLAGRSQRAPTWVRRVELEWAYRLMKEPWRWRRQLALPIFACLAADQALRSRVKSRLEAEDPPPDQNQ